MVHAWCTLRLCVLVPWYSGCICVAINDSHGYSMSLVCSWNEVGDVLCQVSSSLFCTCPSWRMPIFMEGKSPIGVIFFRAHFGKCRLWWRGKSPIGLISLIFRKIISPGGRKHCESMPLAGTSTRFNVPANRPLLAFSERGQLSPIARFESQRSESSGGVWGPIKLLGFGRRYDHRWTLVTSDSNRGVGDNQCHADGAQQRGAQANASKRKTKADKRWQVQTNPEVKTQTNTSKREQTWTNANKRLHPPLLRFLKTPFGVPLDNSR